MRKRRKLLLSLGCGILTAVLLFVLTSEHEPAAQGHTLSYWVSLSTGFNGPKPAMRETFQEKEQANAAIQQIGTNALPFLLAWMDYEPPRWKLTLRTQALKLPHSIINRWPVKLFIANQAIDRVWGATMAFSLLGTTAAPAIHELEIRARTNSVEKSSRALLALSFIGPAAVPSMAGALSNPSLLAGQWTRASILRLGTDASPLITLLIQNLDNTNAPAALTCAQTLGDLRLQPTLVIPALTRKLDDPSANVRIQIPLSLASFGRLSTPALPQLTNALLDSNVLVRQNATNAIARITGTALPYNPIAAAPSNPYE